jgi:AcrR family transcriptional regulator
MGDDRDRILDAGLAVVVDHGVRGLTHDAVDAAGGLAPGSADAAFPTPKALLEGVTQRCIERELLMAAPVTGDVEASAEGLAALLGQFARRALGEDRIVTLARYALQSGAAQDPDLRAHYAVGADEVDTWAVDLVRRAGSRHPERDTGILANYMTGLVFHELALPTPGFDAPARAREVIDMLGWRSP